MTHEKKIEYMGIAASIVGYHFEDKALDMLVSLYELIIQKEGETDLKSVSKVQAEATERASVKTRTELVDKVSKRVDTSQIR